MVKLGVTVLVAMLLHAQNVEAQTYSITDLGNLFPNGLNDSGQVVGVGYNTSGDFPFLYSGGSVQNLGNLGADAGAVGLNNAGQVVGWSQTAPGSAQRAFLYRAGVMQDIGTLSGYNGAGATAINASGQIAGFASYLGETRALLYNNGIIQDLGTLGGASSTSRGLNDSGKVVGWSYTSSGLTHAFSYTGGILQDLGTLGGNSSVANAINNSDQIVGYAETSAGQPRAFLYSAGVMYDLRGGDGSVAHGINDDGQIVGSADVSGVAHAFIFENGVALDLNQLIPANNGWTLEDAKAINNLGQIVGLGLSPDGSSEAFLLSPVAIPEPGSLLAGMFASLFLLTTTPVRKAVRRAISSIWCRI